MKNTNETPEQILADSGYASYENLKYLKDKNIEGYIPDQMLQSYQQRQIEKTRNFTGVNSNMIVKRIVIFARWATSWNTEASFD